MSSNSRSGQVTEAPAATSLAVQRPFLRRPIPPEILELIFLSVVDFQSRTLEGSCCLESTSARSLSQVCRQWRLVALKSKELWRQTFDPDTATLAWAQVVLQRCGSRPLALVSARPSSPSDDPAKWNLIGTLQPQFEYIFVDVRHPTSGCLQRLLGSPSQRLVDATVMWDSIDRDIQLIPPSLTDFGRPLFGNNVPNLHRLRLVNFAFPFAGRPQAPLSFPSLRQLSLEYTPKRRGFYSGIWPATVLKIVQAHPFLTHLTLSHCVASHQLDLGGVTQHRLPFLQSFSYSGTASVFLALSERLELPAMCDKHLFIHLDPHHDWSRASIDDLITCGLGLIPILPYVCMGICIQYNRLYIALDEPEHRHEISFDIQELSRFRHLPPPDLARRILELHSDTEEYSDIDYFACAVNDWLRQHPMLYRSVRTLKYRSATRGVSAVLMLYMLWALPNLERLHVATCRTLNSPHLLASLANAQPNLPTLDRLRCLIIPFCALVDMSTPPVGPPPTELRGAFQSCAPTSALGVTQRLEVAVSPELSRLCGSNIEGVVEGRIEGLQGLLAPWIVSWTIVDDSWINYPLRYAQFPLSDPHEENAVASH
ncbi:hypothetical protein FA13DRAFT_1801029 [Coprinellus micaceus]|uniref:F-box domain-containing protein n=1 Tax=Coprinellus micaceus TaxID=71717 RepID=A0A4Y7SFJ0_COPMI|nr:hypothetical protein FA13DRAFT_1801029 [Coprinellus micaceus]